MKNHFYRIIIIILVFNSAYGQIRSNLKTNKVPVNSHGLSHAQGVSFLNSNKFSMNQSFGMSMTNYSGQSISMGTYSNQIEYFFNEKMRLRTDIGISYPMGGSSPLMKNSYIKPQMFYGANLDYKFNDNMFLKFSINNYPRYNNSRSRYQNNR